MTLQLQKIPAVLRILNERLQEEHEIKDNVVRLVEEGFVVSDYFCITLTSQRKNFIKLVQMLEESNVSDVDVSGLKILLQDFSQALKDAENKATIMKRNTNDAIENLRRRRKCLDKDIKNMEVDMLRLADEIKSYKNMNEELTRQAKENEAAEKQLRELASSFRTKAQNRRNVGALTSLYSLAVGIITAPLTGGASLLVLGGLAGVNFGVHLGSAEGCDDKANNLKKEAENQRQQARQNEGRILENQRRQDSLSCEQTNLRIRKDRMTDAMNALEQVTGHLCGAINIIHKAFAAVQDLETDLHKIDLQSDTFKVVQKSLVNNPVKVQGVAQKQLDKLLVKLRGLRDLLVQLLPQEAIQ